MQHVFRALAAETRREILDLLRAQSGLTLNELCENFEMSRYGVMKHLAVLKEANLIVVRREGRCSRHYLNAAPIHDIANRWLSQYDNEAMARYNQLKETLENQESKTKDRSQHGN